MTGFRVWYMRLAACRWPWLFCRDGRHFADILNYLRTQQLAYPHDGTDYK